ncbi:MAG: hypothetical protein IJA45_06895 [Oscillospiraceae bacterium]|nr:hypothetical protein [Oscillospiraceae bacterium]
MNRKEILSNIFMQFERSAHMFCKESNGLFCEIESEYKGAEQIRNLKQKTARIYYGAFVIEFVYSAHGVMGVVNSILSCDVYLDKTENAVGIPLQLMTDYCEMDVNVPLCIPYITNGQAMTQAFQCMTNVLEKLLPTVSQRCCDSDSQEELQQKFRDELLSVFQMDVLELRLPQQRRALANFFVTRFSNGAFLTALRENYGKAVKQLGKSKNLTGYEKRMLRIWQSQQNETSAYLPTVRANAKVFNGYGTAKTERKEFAAVFFGWIALLPVSTALYLGLYALLVCIVGWNSVYLMGPSYNYPFCILGGFITATAGSYFTRYFFFKRLFKKDYAQYREIESIQNVDKINNVMKGFLAVIVAACVALCLLLANWNLKFLQDGFVDNSKFLSLHGEYCGYDEVAYIYYKPDRVNGYGETLEYPSYVIVLRDGREIDLYEHGDIADYSGELLDILREKGIEVK